ncbi:MAG: ABC-F family ATP-binding cassette domain-containing protein, partial [Bacilli bacterium]
MLLSLNNISLEFGVQKILDDISINIDDHSKLAVIGNNGVGKSSLLEIIDNYQDLNPNNYHAKANLVISYLKQETMTFENNDILSYVLDNNQVDEYEAKAILSKLGINDLGLPLNQLSGGQKKRVALTKALVKKCDLLILDEPTNHLDMEMITWLEKHLQQTKKALVMITHDRYFLERITNQIYELNNAHLDYYQGNYSEYLKAKQERLLSSEASYNKKLTLLKEEQAWMLQGAKARETKSKERIQRFNDLQASLVKQAKTTLSLDINNARIGKKILEIQDLAVGYSTALIKDFTYTFKQNERIALIGNNGSGKTSFLKTLALQIKPLQGNLEYGSTIKIGYFAQDNEILDVTIKVIDYIRN